MMMFKLLPVSFETPSVDVPRKTTFVQSFAACSLNRELVQSNDMIKLQSIERLTRPLVFSSPNRCYGWLFEVELQLPRMVTFPKEFAERTQHTY